MRRTLVALVIAFVTAAVALVAPAGPVLAHTKYVTTMDRTCSMSWDRQSITCTRFGQRVTYRAEPGHSLFIDQGAVWQIDSPRDYDPQPNTTY